MIIAAIVVGEGRSSARAKGAQDDCSTDDFGGGQEETWIGTGTFGGARGNAALWNDTFLLLYMNRQVYPQTNSDAEVHFYNYNSSLTSMPI